MDFLFAILLVFARGGVEWGGGVGLYMPGWRGVEVRSGGVGCAGEVGWDGMVWVGHEKELTLDLLPKKETEHH